MPNENTGQSNGMTGVKLHLRLLRNNAVSTQFLAYADYSKPFVLHTDASTTGLGAVLYQKQSDGKERVIAYVSQSLN